MAREKRSRLIKFASKRGKRKVSGGGGGRRGGKGDVHFHGRSFPTSGLVFINLIRGGRDGKKGEE